MVKDDRGPMRGMDDLGYQLVQVDGKYDYRWRGDHVLEIGECVVLPSSIHGSGEPWFGFVTAYGADYQGRLSDITRKATYEERLTESGRRARIRSERRSSFIDKLKAQLTGGS